MALHVGGRVNETTFLRYSLNGDFASFQSLRFETENIRLKGEFSNVAIRDIRAQVFREKGR